MKTLSPWPYLCFFPYSNRLAFQRDTSDHITQNTEKTKQQHFQG